MPEDENQEELYKMMVETVTSLWENNNVINKIPERSTTFLLKELKSLNIKRTRIRGQEVLLLVNYTKELVKRYNNNEMDKYRLQFIQEINRLPSWIKPLVKLNETI